MKIQCRLIILFALIQITSCSEVRSVTAEDYLSEAAAVCGVFSPENWKNTSGLEPVDVQRLLSERIASSVKSKEMSNIIKAIPQVESGQRYNFYIREVQKLTQSQHECPALRDYFSF